MKNQKGITLVALVITIIVLLILAGVSISLVIGNNGVLTQASNSVIKNNVASVKEDLTVALAACDTKYYTAWAVNSATTRASVYEGANSALVAELNSKYYVQTSGASSTTAISSSSVASGSLVNHVTVSGETATPAKVYVILTKKGTNETYAFELAEGGVSETTGSYTINTIKYKDTSHAEQTVNV